MKPFRKQGKLIFTTFSVFSSQVVRENRRTARVTAANERGTNVFVILPDYLSTNPTNVKKVSFSEEKHLIMRKRLNWIGTTLSVNLPFSFKSTFTVSTS